MKQKLTLAVLLVSLLTLGGCSGTPTGQSAATTPDLPPNLCMAPDGHPVYLEVMGDHSGVYMTYLTREGDLIVRYITIWTDSLIHSDSWKLVGRGTCAAAGQ